jgi:putative glutamine transport system substrate-binding protein
MKNRKIYIILFIATLVTTGCHISSPITVKSIRRTEILRVGVKDDVPGFWFFNTETNRYEGLEIDLAKLIAQEFLASDAKVQFIPVTPGTRGELLNSGELDIVIATFTITEERKLLYNFSEPYYTDALGVMVKDSSGIQTLSDMHNKLIGVLESTPSKAELLSAVDASFIGTTVLFSEHASAIEAKAALESGQVDGFCDWMHYTKWLQGKKLHHYPYPTFATPYWCGDKIRQ